MSPRQDPDRDDTADIIRFCDALSAQLRDVQDAYKNKLDALPDERERLFEELSRRHETREVEQAGERYESAERGLRAAMLDLAGDKPRALGATIGRLAGGDGIKERFLAGLTEARRDEVVRAVRKAQPADRFDELRTRIKAEMAAQAWASPYVIGELERRFKALPPRDGGGYQAFVRALDEFQAAGVGLQDVLQRVLSGTRLDQVPDCQAQQKDLLERVKAAQGDQKMVEDVRARVVRHHGDGNSILLKNPEVLSDPNLTVADKVWIVEAIGLSAPSRVAAHEPDPATYEGADTSAPDPNSRRP